MKKIILVALMSLLGTSAFGVVCSNNYVYELINNDRYFISHELSADKSIFVVDKKSIKKIGNIIEAWVIGEYRSHSRIAYMKIKWKINISNNTAQVISAIGMDCGQYNIYSEDTGKPFPIVPDSANEIISENILNYLNNF
jgi:hypothetical protein